VTSPREAAPQSGAPNNASPLDLDGLQKLAEAASPGSRSVRGSMEYGRFVSDGIIFIETEDGPVDIYNATGETSEEDDEFVAACDRETILALLQRLTDAEAENASLRERLEKGPDRRDLAFALFKIQHPAHDVNDWARLNDDVREVYRIDADSLISVWPKLIALPPREADAAAPRPQEQTPAPSPASQSTEST
jgi:outer membrane protein assembly factor BamB